MLSWRCRSCGPLAIAPTSLRPGITSCSSWLWWWSRSLWLSSTLRADHKPLELAQLHRGFHQLLIGLHLLLQVSSLLLQQHSSLSIILRTLCPHVPKLRILLISSNDLGPVHPAVLEIHIRSEINSTISMFALLTVLISWVWNDSVLVSFFLGLPAMIGDLNAFRINIYRYVASIIFMGLLVFLALISMTLTSSLVWIFLTLIPLPLLLRIRRHKITIVSIWILGLAIFNIVYCLIQWVICPVIRSRCKILINFKATSFMFIS